jgi:hypothetical protein
MDGARGFYLEGRMNGWFLRPLRGVGVFVGVRFPRVAPEELSITHKYARSEDVLAEEIRAQARYFSAVLV